MKISRADTCVCIGAGMFVGGMGYVFGWLTGFALFGFLVFLLGVAFSVIEGARK